jgi:hypothetical protein
MTIAATTGVIATGMRSTVGMMGTAAAGGIRAVEELPPVGVNHHGSVERSDRTILGITGLHLLQLGPQFSQLLLLGLLIEEPIDTDANHNERGDAEQARKNEET